MPLKGGILGALLNGAILNSHPELASLSFAGV